MEKAPRNPQLKQSQDPEIKHKSHIPQYYRSFHPPEVLHHGNHQNKPSPMFSLLHTFISFIAFLKRIFISVLSSYIKNITVLIFWYLLFHIIRLLTFIRIVSCHCISFILTAIYCAIYLLSFWCESELFPGYSYVTCADRMYT